MKLKTLILLSFVLCVFVKRKRKLQERNIKKEIYNQIKSNNNIY